MMAAKDTTNIVVVGGGIQGTSVAYHLLQHSSKSKNNLSVTLLEAKAPASAASGKGGGFMARSWGDGGPTQGLHELAFDMYEQMAKDLDVQSYRKLPVLSVTPGYDGIGAARKNRQLAQIMPDWLDGKSVGRISAMGYGDDTAQVTPAEFVNKMLENSDIKVVLGTCTGIESDQGSERGSRKVTAVKYLPQGENGDKEEEEQSLPCDTVVVSAGPWSCAAEDWFPGVCLLYTSPSPRDVEESRMPSSA